MSHWKIPQMIKASGWPLGPDTLAPGTDFNAQAGNGEVPLHWACREGKASLVEYMIGHGAQVQDRAANGRSMLELAMEAKSFQTVMLLIDQLKATGAAAPDEAFRARLAKVFSDGHPNLRNRLQQTLKDWDRVAGRPARP